MEDRPSKSLSEHSASSWLDLHQQTLLASRKIGHFLREQLVVLGLRDTELLMLWSCCQAHPHGIAQHELAWRTGTSTGQTSHLVDSLRQRGLLEGYRLTRDRRRQYWRLTREGLGVSETILRAIEPLAEQLEVNCGNSLARELCDHLTRLIDAIGDTIPRTARQQSRTGTAGNGFQRGAA